MKELEINMMFYMIMKDGETEEEAKERFWNEFTTEAMTTESFIKVHNMEVQEM